MRTANASSLALTLLAFAGLATGCPGQVDEKAAAADAGKTARVTAEDERVVEVGGDLYVKEAKSNPAEAPPTESPGTGKPDETNGVCRLYAPKYPNPQCCVNETGFDVETAKQVCGHAVYLGESHRMTCGYFFSDAELKGHPSFRASIIAHTDAKKAADIEAEQLGFQQRKWDIKPKPIEGIDGAWLVEQGRFRWAFLPGWKNVRKVSWVTESCADDKVVELLKVVAAAKEPGKDDARPMIPAARG